MKIILSRKLRDLLFPKKKSQRKRVKNKGRGGGPCALSRAEQPQPGWAGRPPHSPSFHGRPSGHLAPLSLSDDWCESHPRSRSPTTGGPPLPVLPAPGAEALVGLFAGDEHPPGIPIPSLALPFLLCGAEHPPNPNLRLFGYLIPPNFEPFGKNCRMYMCTPMSLW
jgi:hypothetical protein